MKQKMLNLQLAMVEVHFLSFKTNPNYGFSDCTDVQLMYQDLSKKVMDVAYERVKEIAMKHYPGCKSEEAWNKPCSYQFQQCTKEISGSNEKIHVPLHTIENLAANSLNTSMAIDIQISQLMEGVNPFDKKGHMPLIKFLQDLSASYEPKTSCTEKSKYFETTHTVGAPLESASFIISSHLFGLGVCYKWERVLL